MLYWYSLAVASDTCDAMQDDLGLVLRFTRNWIHYGFLGHTVVCVVIAAAKGLLETYAK